MKKIDIDEINNVEGKLTRTTITAEHIQFLGKHFASGVMSYLANLSIFAGLAIVLLVLLYGYFGWGMDSTDTDQWSRSGLHLYVDHLTGVNYVGTANGLTVRVNTNGLPVVTK